MFHRKGVLRNFAKFTGKHLCHSLFFNKVAGLLIKKETLAQVFFCKFGEISKNTFFCRTPPMAASEKPIWLSVHLLLIVTASIIIMLAVFTISGFIKNSNNTESLRATDFKWVLNIKYKTSDIKSTRGGYRTATTSNVELFKIVLSSSKPLTIITKSFTLDVAGVLDPPLSTDFLYQSLQLLLGDHIS